MRAIRAAAPQARLVLTEDLGRVYATPRLAYQAAFENERRWLTFDVLCGRFAPGHPMWDFFRWAGVGAGELAAAADECAGEGPEMLGVNHYLTGERFLDERLERYPPRAHGGNGRDAYADVEAARVRAEGLAGPYALLHEAWARYRRPLAITEVHLGCTREQQLRWLAQAWDAALAARADGVDVRAVTAWSLFGAFDWASLMTRADGLYEAGAFDVRAPAPRPTAVATVVRQLASRGAYDHPAAAGPGWWETDARLAYPAVSAGPADPRPPVRREPARTILVTGATGTLGRAIARRCAARGLAHQLLSRCELDIAEPRDVARVLDAEAPWALVNAAGYVRVDDAELAREACFRANARGAAVLAEACAARGVRFVTFSSDLVFDGARGLPYRESDAPAPRGVYGASKAEAERRVAALCPSALVVRTSAFFGPWDEHNFVVRVLRALAAAETVVAADDVVVSPTYVPDLADVVLDLLIDGASGLWHLANAGAMTWAELARDAARRAGLDAARVDGCPTSALRLRAERPRYSALASERAALMPPLGEALDRFVRAWRAPAAEPAGAPARAAAP
jgi:dTDP-4-dehydrorhamnose reductase